MSVHILNFNKNLPNTEEIVDNYEFFRCIVRYTNITETRHFVFSFNTKSVKVIDIKKKFASSVLGVNASTSEYIFDLLLLNTDSSIDDSVEFNKVPGFLHCFEIFAF